MLPFLGSLHSPLWYYVWFETKWKTLSGYIKLQSSESCFLLVWCLSNSDLSSTFLSNQEQQTNSLHYFGQCLDYCISSNGGFSCIVLDVLLLFVRLSLTVLGSIVTASGIVSINIHTQLSYTHNLILGKYHMWGFIKHLWIVFVRFLSLSLCKNFAPYLQVKPL